MWHQHDPGSSQSRLPSRHTCRAPPHVLAATRSQRCDDGRARSQGADSRVRYRSVRRRGSCRSSPLGSRRYSSPTVLARRCRSPRRDTTPRPCTRKATLSTVRSRLRADPGRARVCGSAPRRFPMRWRVRAGSCVSTSSPGCRAVHPPACTRASLPPGSLFWGPRLARESARTRECSPRCSRGWPRRTRRRAAGRAVVRRSSWPPQRTSPLRGWRARRQRASAPDPTHGAALGPARDSRPAPCGNRIGGRVRRRFDKNAGPGWRFATSAPRSVRSMIRIVQSGRNSDEQCHRGQARTDEERRRRRTPLGSVRPVLGRGLTEVPPHRPGAGCGPRLDADARPV